MSSTKQLWYEQHKDKYFRYEEKGGLDGRYVSPCKPNGDYFSKFSPNITGKVKISERRNDRLH
jgi:hypothetical protein